jgi:hypothetical protein
MRRRGRDLRDTSNIVHVVTQCHKKVEEELAPSSMHLQLHSPAPLEGASAADYEGEVVGP